MKPLRHRKSCWEGRRAVVEPPPWRSVINQGRALLPELCAARGIRDTAERGKSSVQSHLGGFGEELPPAALYGVFPWDCSFQRAWLGHPSISSHLCPPEL